MGTIIQWTDETWNPVTGCTKVSAGCKHCYAERVFPRAYAGQTVPNDEPYMPWPDEPPAARPRRFTDVMTHPDRLDQPLRWRKPRRVFVNSMSDLFHDDVPDGFIARVWYTMAHCPDHTFQILTMRPDRMRDWCERWADRTGDGDHKGLPPMPIGPEAVRAAYRSGRAKLFADMLDDMGEPPEGAAYPFYDWMEGPRFWWGDSLPNVWLGVSVEDQATADQRIPLLLETPAALRFVSYEPALGPVDFVRAVNQLDWLSPASLTPGGIDWIIIGGESGPNARPFDVDWARNTIRQCRASGVVCFVKQLGANPHMLREPSPNVTALPLKHRAGADPDEWPVDLRVRETPNTIQED